MGTEQNRFGLKIKNKNFSIKTRNINANPEAEDVIYKKSFRSVPLPPIVKSKKRNF